MWSIAQHKVSDVILRYQDTKSSVLGLAPRRDGTSAMTNAEKRKVLVKF